MTLVITLTGQNTIWQMADRRISWHPKYGIRPIDTANKVIELATKDGVALLGYSGLGLTRTGRVEPSKWMAKVLHGRNLTLEESLNLLAAAIKEKIPRNLSQIEFAGNKDHAVHIPAFINGKLEFFAIEVRVDENGAKYKFGYNRISWPYVKGTGRILPRIAVTGSGKRFLEKPDFRQIISLLNAQENGKISATKFSEYLETVNRKVSKQDSFVGPNCVVSWRNKEGAGESIFYENGVRQVPKTFVGIPKIICGRDFNAEQEIIFPAIKKRFESMFSGNPDDSILNEMIDKLNMLPSRSDDILE